MQNLIQTLCAQTPVVTDGAWGTQLQVRGLPISECPELWNLMRPDHVEQVACAYIEAGSQVILTNTFGGNTLSLERYGLGDHVSEINRMGVEISQCAAKGRAKVFASMGPTGQVLAMGVVSPKQILAAFRAQALALADGGADALLIETMSDLAEAELAVQAAQETGLPVIASMTYGSGRNGDRTIMGVTPEQAAVRLTAAGVDAIGANCGEGPEAMLPICRRLRAATDLPLWIKPNAGRPQLVQGHVRYGASSTETFAEQLLALVHAGANYVGGCCGTGPAFIRALSHRLWKEVAA